MLTTRAVNCRDIPPLQQRVHRSSQASVLRVVHGGAP